jgi:hypothetical protein
MDSIESTKFKVASGGNLAKLQSVYKFLAPFNKNVLIEEKIKFPSNIPLFAALALEIIKAAFH